MKKTSAAMFTILLVISSGINTEGKNVWGSDTGTWLKSSYLNSIHDDCRTLLEGIQLFTQRDYPVFIQNIQSGTAVSDIDTANYISELRHFKKLLDSLYEEYISFKTSSLLSKKDGEDALEKNSLTILEKSLYQMFTYAYIRTGDIIMAHQLMEHRDILSENVTIKIRNLEGILTQFPLTENLQREAKTSIKKLGILTLHLKNFLPTDRQEINTYLKISDYNKKEPINIMYMEYYGHYFPGLKTGEKTKMIHMGRIVDFLSTLKYKTAASIKSNDAETNADFHKIYQFPIIKGDYELIIRDPHIRAFSQTDDAVTIERLCFFKGLARTDFRTLKQEEQRQKKKIVEETLLLIDQRPTYVSYQPGQMVPYGVYALYDKDRHLGTINLIPCSKGGTCKESVVPRENVTPIRIFDHTFILYRDILDLITRDQRLYQTSPSPLSKTPANNRIDFLPGCTQRADGHGSVDIPH